MLREEALAETAPRLPGWDQREEVTEVLAFIGGPLEESRGDGGQERGVPVEAVVLQHIVEKSRAVRGRLKVKLR